MLDGNAVMNHLSEALLQKLAAGNPPVLVAVGYQTPLPFDLAARTLDYTPPQQVQDRRGRPAGGSAAFRQLLEQTIAPRAEQHLPINAQQRALWGHSYGGLFVLDSYLTSGFFQRYFAASPSLRGDATLLQQMAAVTPASFKQKQLVLMEGNGESRRRQRCAEPDSHHPRRHAGERRRLASSCFPGSVTARCFRLRWKARCRPWRKTVRRHAPG